MGMAQQMNSRGLLQLNGFPFKMSSVSLHPSNNNTQLSTHVNKKSIAININNWKEGTSPETLPWEEQRYRGRGVFNMHVITHLQAYKSHTSSTLV
jgi:hypothetical protein